jgi:glutamine synthetase
LLSRVAEDFGITITLEPKLFKDFNGAGAHINFSTKDMRDGTQGMPLIHEVIEKLKTKH